MNYIKLVVICSSKLQCNNGNTETTALRCVHKEITLALIVARSAPVFLLLADVMPHITLHIRTATVFLPDKSPKFQTKSNVVLLQGVFPCIISQRYRN